LLRAAGEVVAHGLQLEFLGNLLDAHTVQRRAGRSTGCLSRHHDAQRITAVGAGTQAFDAVESPQPRSHQSAWSNSMAAASANELVSLLRQLQLLKPEQLDDIARKFEGKPIDARANASKVPQILRLLGQRDRILALAANDLP
jgi:hypothetical protein